MGKQYADLESHLKVIYSNRINTSPYNTSSADLEQFFVHPVSLEDRLFTPPCFTRILITGWSEPVLINVYYGAPELIPRNEIRQPM